MEARDEVQRVGEMADKSSRVKRTGQGGCGAWGLKEARNWYLYPFLPTALFHFSCLSLSLPCLCFQMEEQRLGILPWVSEMSMLVTNWTFDSAGDTPLSPPKLGLY